MLSQLLNKLRGIDKWPTTKATVISTKIARGYRGSWNTVLFTYKPKQESVQHGKLVADDQTTLFGINVSDTFDIQYDPLHSSRTYCEDAIRPDRDLGIAIVGIVALFAIYQIFAALVRHFKH